MGFGEMGRAQEQQQRSAGSMRRIDSPRGKLFPGRALAERESESEPYRMELLRAAATIRRSGYKHQNHRLKLVVDSRTYLAQ